VLISQEALYVSMHVFIPGDMALTRNNEVTHYVPQTSAVWQVTRFVSG
jgi:hypothetical protein